MNRPLAIRPAPRKVPRSRTGRLCCRVALCLATVLGSPWLCPPARADAPIATPEQRSRGFAPDAQLAGGGGFALRKPLDNGFLARARLGILYAGEPWIVNLGATLEVGALARFGVGGELELNVAHGFFGYAGLAHVQGDRLMLHAGLGWLVFAVEWQHRFERTLPRDALMFEVRVPLGIWWMRQRQRSAPAPSARAAPSVRPERPVGVISSASRSPADAVPLERRASDVRAEVQTQQLQTSLVTAARAHAAGDFAGEAVALSHAYSLSQDPAVALQLAAAEEAQGHWVLALSDLRRALASDGLSAEQRADAEQRRLTLSARLPHLRLELRGAHGSERVSIDGTSEPSAGLGYDVPIDPGEHQLRVTRFDQSLAEQRFHAREAELVRVVLDLAAPTSAP